MLTGQTARFVEFKTSTAYGSLLSADLDGPTLPPSGSPNFIIEAGSTALHQWKFHVDWVTTANSTFTGPSTISIAAYNQLCASTRSCVAQPGTSVKLDGLGDRLMFRLAYRNFGSYETMVVSHSVNAAASGTQAGVRWYEIRNPNATPTIYQQGTFAPTTDHRWMPSIAMDRDGNIAVGPHIGINTHDTLAFGGKRLIATIGVAGLVIVDTDDAVLVCSREHEQAVRELVDLLKSKDLQQWL